jgi:hypothetical protein
MSTDQSPLAIAESPLPSALSDPELHHDSSTNALIRRYRQRREVPS